MKRIVLLSLFSLFSILVFGSFPVDILMDPEVTNPEKFKLDTLAFVLGILTFLLLPYSLVLLLIRKKNFRGSLAWGWLAGLILIVLVVLVIFLNFFGLPDIDFPVY